MNALNSRLIRQLRAGGKRKICRAEADSHALLLPEGAEPRMVEVAMRCHHQVGQSVTQRGGQLFTCPVVIGAGVNQGPCPIGVHPVHVVVAESDALDRSHAAESSERVS